MHDVLCSPEGVQLIKDDMAKDGINTIIIAACSPRAKAAEFTFPGALVERVNIREFVAWTMEPNTDETNDAAYDYLTMGIVKTQKSDLAEPNILPDLTSTILVIGGGIAGMTSALGLADQGFAVHLVEKEAQLGGNARSLLTTWQGQNIGEKIAEMIERIAHHSLIDVYAEAEVKAATGFIGNFETTISGKKGDILLSHGAIVMATGAKEHVPTEYLYGEDDRVLTHLELDRAIAAKDSRIAGAESVVFIQCVGSREPERPYCSKVCCTHSIKSAINFKKMNPEINVFVIYRDIRTYGQRESLYKEARQRGVIFIRYDSERKPVVRKESDGLWITARDHVLDMDVEIHADLLVLASAIVPRNNEGLAQMFKLSCHSDRFFNEAHAKLRPVEFATAGIFLAGMAHYPKPIEESIAQAAAAASRAAVTLSKESITIEGIVSHVRDFMCRGCGECEKVCPFNAISVELVEDTGKIAVVREALCKGCGMCAVACPTGAASVHHYGNEEVLTMVESAFEE
jgi:heterodisulfide reductase subunit A